MDKTGNDSTPTDQPEGTQALLTAPPPRKLIEARPGLSAASPPRERHWVRWVIILLAVLAAIWLIWRIWPAKKAAPVVAAVPVGVAKIVNGNMRVVLTGLGTVTPIATVTVQTQISGQLMSVGFKEGQIVKKGDFLAQIDPRPYQVALEQAEGTLAHDTGLLNQAKSDLARYVILNSQDSISKQEVTDQQYLVQQDQGTVMDDQGTVDNAKLNLTYCHIVSPVTGRLGLRLVDPGNYVQTSSGTGLVVATQLQPISVIFVLPEDDIPELAEQMQTNAGMPVTIYDRSNDKQLAQGNLTVLDNTVDTTTGTVKLRASFPNANLALFPNEFVNARLLLKTLTQVPEVPVRALQDGAPGSSDGAPTEFVYLINPDNTVGVQLVTTGITDGDNVQVLSGLKAGDTVVIDGTDLLRDGAKVKITADAGNAPVTTNDGPGAPPGEQTQNSTPVSGGSQSTTSTQ